MTLRVSLHEGVRPLARPQENAHQRWLERTACVITLTADNGQCGRGEASPLPGFSRDTLRECQDALAAFDPRGLPERLEPGHDLFLALAQASQPVPASAPAARAALEGALLDLWARVASLPAWALLMARNADAPAARSIATLLPADPAQALQLAREAHGRGVGTFKVKIGKAPLLQQQLSTVRDLRRELGPGVKLRLDANRSLSLDQARTWLPRFAEIDPEFVEEPCAASEGATLGSYAVPYALDESLSELDVARADLSGVRALILKPTTLGGITPCCAWARRAADAGVEVVLSHCFEGPLGLALSAALALSVGSERLAHGLDRSEPWLAAWPEPGFGTMELGT